MTHLGFAIFFMFNIEFFLSFLIRQEHLALYHSSCFLKKEKQKPKWNLALEVCFYEVRVVSFPELRHM